MNNWFSSIAENMHWIPFIGMVRHAPQSRPILTRIIEQAIPGILVAVIGIYVTDARQTEQIKELRYEIVQLNVEIQQMRSDLYVPRSEIRHGASRK